MVPKTYVDYTALSSQTDFAFPFPYLEDTHVVVEIDGDSKTLNTDFTIPSVGLVRLNSGATAGQAVRVKRVSDFATDLVNFVNGSVLNEADLDRAYQHNRYLNEEANEGVASSLALGPDGTYYEANNKRISNLADPLTPQDAATKNFVAAQVDAAAFGHGGAPGVMSTTANGTDATYNLNFDVNHSNASVFDVSIDGVVQEPTSAYTISGGNGTITFTSIPPNGAKIVVIERGYRAAFTDIPSDYDYGNLGATAASYDYGYII